MNEKREALAAYSHDSAWAGWMKYMFSKGQLEAIVSPDGKETIVWTMPPALYDRWQRQMNTLYADLPEDMKTSDRAEADKMLAIMEVG